MPRHRVPTYRLHKPSGQAVCTVRTTAGARRDVYLGAFDSPESRREYARIVAELAVAPAAPQGGLTPPARITIDELLVAFLTHAQKHYRRADGTTTDQVTEFKAVARPLHDLYGATLVADFGPTALKAVRQHFIERGNCRTLVNNRMGKLRRVFKWGVAEELVPVAVHAALCALAPLQRGRTEARESEPVEPVDPAAVDATLPFLNRHVRGLVEFMRYTGCRPSEAAALRRADLDTTGDVWLYKPATHKSAYRGKSRTIAIGPRAQELLRGYFTDNPLDYLFSPRRAVEERNARAKAGRKSPMTPSQLAREPKKNPKRRAAEKYNRRSILTAVYRAAAKAGVQRWHVYQLRHAHATEVRKRFDLDSARAALGHSRSSTTETYAQRDEGIAVKVANELG